MKSLTTSRHLVMQCLKPPEPHGRLGASVSYVTTGSPWGGPRGLVRLPSLIPTCCDRNTPHWHGSTFILVIDPKYYQVLSIFIYILNSHIYFDYFEKSNNLNRRLEIIRDCKGIIQLQQGIPFLTKFLLKCNSLFPGHVKKLT